MVNKETKIKSKKDILVSEYIANPHLINNFKYDLRVYVLVTSYDPLKIYMFNDGLARFATYEYNTNAKDIKKRFIHLTNFAVNKHSKKFVKNSKAEQDGQGSKWSLTALKAYYESVGINSQKVQIDDNLVILRNKRHHHKDMHQCRTSDAGYLLKDPIEKELWIWVVWVWYFGWFSLKAMANGSERMPIIKFIITYG